MPADLGIDSVARTRARADDRLSAANEAHYRLSTSAIRALVALLILREKIIKPVLAGAGKPKPGRPLKRMHPLDMHYQTLQRELRHTLDTLGLAA
jgi:hypothetical protein